ncbi:MAG: sulfurtransferase TusA family protein [Dorea sp.]|nr:sulfurtransferase TusA family protein [Dorea sp.]
MKVVDARGLSCPEPIMLTVQALKKESEIQVLVTEPHQRTNVEKCAKDKGKTVTVVEKEDYFELTIK